MIVNREEKKSKIIETITNRIGTINDLYRTGPSLYFYKRLIELRDNAENISMFMNNEYNIEIVYATLVAWDMDSRGAKMKYFDEFRDNLTSCLTQFMQIEEYNSNDNPYQNSNQIIALLEETYRNLNLMKTNAKLVSSSKLLHFLFPKLCIPMDRTNTLKYLYGNTHESINKFVEINKFAFEIINSIENWSQYFDNTWNTSVPKLIDNAIIIICKLENL